ncbi:MAG: hypothetical protein IIT53_11320, partial [Fibrobacter sp.]|nr:hypothetical protein [Fibrobacter sp.]
KIVEEFYSLVDPETDFDPFNTWLTGISEESVQDAPTFPVRKIASRDCFAGLAMTLFKPTITLFIPNFLILYSFFSSMRNFHTQQTSSTYPINIRNYY